MEYKSDIVNVAVTNFKPESGNKKVNLKKITELAITLAKRGANIILFPEMCLTGYDLYVDQGVEKEYKIALAETAMGYATTHLSEVARELKVYIVFGMPELCSQRPGTLYNSAVVVGPQGLTGVYRKIHPFDSENTWCAKGDKPFMFETPWGPISVGICYDTYQFPELMRYYAAKGSRLYLNPTAISRDRTVSFNSFREGYVKYLECAVITNHIFIASSNLVGQDGKTHFGGGSTIYGPKETKSSSIYCSCYAGDVDCDQENSFLETINLSLARRTIFQNNKYTGVPDYRPELYRNFT